MDYINGRLISWVINSSRFGSNYIAGYHILKLKHAKRSSISVNHTRETRGTETSIVVK